MKSLIYNKEKLLFFKYFFILTKEANISMALQGVHSTVVLQGVHSTVALQGVHCTVVSKVRI